MKQLLFGLITACLLANAPAAFSQVPVKVFNRSDFTPADSLRLLREHGRQKQLPENFALQALVALSYFPELKNVRIKFVVKPAYSLLQTRPDGRGIFNRKTRQFTVIISDSTYWKLQAIRLGAAMNFNAQVGVLGHELSHVSDFIKRSFIDLAMSGVKHISSRYIDLFEYRTDSICIAHGLGYQLLAWSQFVRQTLHTNNYDGADNINKPMMHERYMNPTTITTLMQNMKMYKAIR